MMTNTNNWWQSLPKIIKYPLYLLGSLTAAGLESKYGLGLVDWFFDWARSLTPTYDYTTYFQIHPARKWILIITAAILLSAIPGSLLFGYRTIRNQTLRIQELTAVKDGFGIAAYWDSKVQEEISAAWKECTTRIMQHPSDLRIMGASGWNTFGCTKAPLHNLIQEYTGTVQILLMDPESPCLTERAESLGMRIEEYKKEIQDSIEFLRKIKRTKNKNIELKLYKHPLIWKMIQTPSFLWLQHYTHGQHVSATPVYGFVSQSSNSYSLVENTSLYLPLMSVFKKRWELDGSLTSDQILGI